VRIFVDANLLIYLNVKLPEFEARLIEDFWLDLLSNHELYTNVLVLDETIYISMKRYKTELKDTLEFIDKAVLPYVDILPVGLNEYLKAKDYVIKYKLKPSDAIHLATIETNGLQAIASEDRDFDKTGVKRVWIKEKYF